MGKHILGIDPGFQGCLAIYDPEMERIVAVLDMPLREQARKKDKRAREIDLFTLSQWIGIYCENLRFACVEKTSAHPGQDIQAMYRFGYGAGAVMGVLAAFNVETKLLLPAVWKTVMGLGNDKAKSLELARKLFPRDAPLFARKKDDGRAEAVLLAYLGGLLVKTGNA